MEEQEIKNNIKEMVEQAISKKKGIYIKRSTLHDEDDQKLFLGMIKMRQDKIRQEIDKLDVSEKILLVGDIWDSIVLDCSTMPPLQEWQKKELDKRLADYETGKLTPRDWKDVHNEIREQYK